MKMADDSRSPLGIACGKVILLGEHAVVHGVPAIAVGIDRGAHARATLLSAGPSELLVPEWDVHVREGESGPMIAQAFSEIVRVTRERLAESGRALVPSRVEGLADLPPGGGLGCSAATGVAVARALDPSANAAEIASRVMAWERVFHGNPSGVDAAVAARGGCVYFQRGEPIVSLRLRGELTLAVGSTGVPSSTKTMVDAVAARLASDPVGTRALFEAVRHLVFRARGAIESGDVTALGRTLDENQDVLDRLSLSTSAIDTMCRAAKATGALGAKLTGAGGGGSVVALVDSVDQGERVVAAWQRDGFTGFVTRVRGSIERRPETVREDETEAVP